MRKIVLSAVAAALAGCATVSAQQSVPTDAVDTSAPLTSLIPGDVAESTGDSAAADPHAETPDAATSATPNPAETTTDAGESPDATSTAATPPLDRDAALEAINAYLAELDVLTGSFLQLEPTGAVATGKFWLDRPGRIRFEYDDPHPFTIVADGATYTVWDRELEDVNTRVPLRETPLNMFLRRDVNLARDAIILNVTDADGELAVELKDPDERVEGSLTLVFARPALDLRRLITTDATGQSTEIIFTDTTRGGRVDPAMFVIRENRRRRGP